MTNNFIVANEDLAFELDARLEGLPFKTRESFVQMYNSGLINRKNDTVSELVDQLIQAYKGIEKRADGITFLDMGEISADELVAKAEAYSLVLRLQRIAKEAAANRQLNDGSLIYFGKGNAVYRVGATSEEGVKEADQMISSEKLPKVGANAEVAVGEILGIEDYSLSTPFEATKLLGVRSEPVINALSALG